MEGPGVLGGMVRACMCEAGAALPAPSVWDEPAEKAAALDEARDFAAFIETTRAPAALEPAPAPTASPWGAGQLDLFALHLSQHRRT
jgi:hypothetical protein